MVDAADFYKTPPPPKAPDWTGTYGGIAGGFGWGGSGQTDPGVVLPGPIDGGDEDGGHLVRGWLAGVTLGTNLQRGPLVVGVEGDFSWADIKGQSNVCGTPPAVPHPCGAKLDALGTFRGRAGFATGPGGNWLLYATGGLAVGHLQAWDALMPASGNVWRAGWTAGVGVETAFAPNWTAKLEFLYVDFGDAHVFDVLPGVPESVSFSTNLVRAGINYRFGGSPAIPQPYVKAPTIAGWSGWYGGLNAGYIDGSRIVNTDAVVISNSSTPTTAPAMARGATSQLTAGRDGFIGGAQIGYNAMLSPVILAGIEADFQGSTLSGRGSASTSSLVDTIFGPNTGRFLTGIDVSRHIDFVGTVRGRLGATLSSSMLLYVTGGLAYGGVRSTTAIDQAADVGGVNPNAVRATFADVRAGYAVGAGGEWMFLPKWSLKAEYLYYDLGSANYGTGRLFVNEGPTNLPGFGDAGIGTSTRVRFNGNIARVGVNYHLN